MSNFFNKSQEKFFNFHKIVLLLLLISCIPLNLTANDLTSDLTADFVADVSTDISIRKSVGLNIEYNIIAELNAAPLIVNADHFAVLLGGGVGFGVRFNERWSVGLRFDTDYYSIGAALSDSISGAELSFRWLIIGAARLTEWVSLYYGAGVSLSFSSYGRASDGHVKQTAVGPSLLFEPRFYIPKFRYVDFAVKCETNLCIADTILPIVYGAARVNVHPYIQWISLYLETGVRYTGYENDILRSDMAQFVLSLGVSLDLFVGHKTKRQGDSSATFGMTKKKEMGESSDEITDETNDKSQNDLITENETKSAESEEPSKETSTNALVVADMDDETKAAYQELIDHLESTTGAKVVSFSDILFAPNTDQMLEGSEAVLDEVVRMLDENELMRINICGYTNNVGNKKMEIKTSKKRVNKVVNYLVLHGVDVFRLEVAAYGGENVKTAGINKANRRVEIRVLEDKE